MAQYPEWDRHTLTVTSGLGTHACNCIGPQPGEPFCPCMMRQRGIFRRNGRWIEPARGERDLGPAHPPDIFDTSGNPTGET